MTDQSLRAKAEAATPGPWLSPTFAGGQVLTGDSWTAVCVLHESTTKPEWRDHRMAAWEDGRGPRDEEANAAFIAAANPAAVLDLLDRLESYRRLLDVAGKALERLASSTDALRQQMNPYGMSEGLFQQWEATGNEVERARAVQASIRAATESMEM